MIGLDTNLLLRYLAQEDTVQSPRATDIITRRLTEEEPGERVIAHQSNWDRYPKSGSRTDLQNHQVGFHGATLAKHSSRSSQIC